MRNKKEAKIQSELKKIFKKVFKVNKKFFSMENTLNWDSLNHLRLVSEIQKKFKIHISNINISKITDQKKIIKFLLKKN